MCKVIQSNWVQLSSRMKDSEATGSQLDTPGLIQWKGYHVWLAVKGFLSGGSKSGPGERQEMSRHRGRTNLPMILISSWYLMTLLKEYAFVESKFKLKKSL